MTYSAALLSRALERKNIWSWVTTGPQTKIDCADEDHQQFIRVT
jgi:hypothetical protein